MANALDLEEQEQLDEIKHFWKQYGDLITWLLIAVLGVYAAWNGYQYWQRTQAAQASALFDEVERAALATDSARLERAYTDMKDKFPGTLYAGQAGLLTAKVLFDKGDLAGARSALGWVVEKSADPGVQAIARLRLAALMAQDQAAEDALKLLEANWPPAFEALALDRRGDILAANNKKDQARDAYRKAWQQLDEQAEYRRFIEVKLNALGVDPKAAKSEKTEPSKPTTAASGASS